MKLAIMMVEIVVVFTLISDIVWSASAKVSSTLSYLNLFPLGFVPIDSL